MVELAPFRALLFAPDAPRIAGGGRFCVAPLTRRDADGSFHTAADTYRRWRREGVLVPERESNLWVLEITSADGSQHAGLVGGLILDDGVVPHEAVQPALVADRVARLRALPIDLSPITAYTERSVPEVDQVIDRLRESSADLTISDEDGGRFRLWRLTGGTPMTAWDSIAPYDGTGVGRGLEPTRVIVADGHHRVSAAGSGIGVGGPASTLAFLLPRPPPSRAVHRWLEAPPHADILVQLGQLFRVEPLPGPAELARRLENTAPQAIFGLLTPGQHAFVLAPRDEAALRQRLPAERSSTWRALDQTLWGFGVAPLLEGITSTPTTDPCDALQRLHRHAESSCALLMFRPIPTDVVTDLALAGETLPPKVTWFSPKPRTGLLLRELEEDA